MAHGCIAKPDAMYDGPGVKEQIKHFFFHYRFWGKTVMKIKVFHFLFHARSIEDMLHRSNLLAIRYFSESFKKKVEKILTKCNGFISLTHSTILED